MSIFHYIKKTPKTEEIDLLIKLKYGEPTHTDEYLNSLPDSVVDTVYDLLSNPSAYRRTVDQKKVVLSIHLRQPVNKPKAEKAIHESLVVYHSLLGTL
jgi:hypothetical protein